MSSSSTQLATAVRVALDRVSAPPALTFKEIRGRADFSVQPAAAIKFMTAKGLQPTFSYLDMVQEEHSKAFTVAKMMDTDLLAFTHDTLTRAIDEGWSARQWIDSVRPSMEAAGWWGKQMVTDPLTGETVEAVTGTPWRLQTIFRTNMQASYAVGQWQQARISEAVAPLLYYDAIDDHRTRPEHAALDGTLLPVSHDFWRTHFPPNGYNCRCNTIQMTQDQAARVFGRTEPSPDSDLGTYKWTNPRTGKTYDVPDGVHPGFAYNPGTDQITAVETSLAEKIAALPAKLKAAAVAAPEWPYHVSQEEANAKFEAYLRAGQDPEAAAALALDELEALAAKSVADALEENTQYLASAIKSVQKTAAGQAMSPSELLHAAKVKAAKAKQSAAIAHYKQAVIAGKPPSAKAKAAFEALDGPAREKVLGEIKSYQDAATEIATAQAAKPVWLPQTAWDEWWSSYDTPSKYLKAGGSGSVGPKLQTFVGDQAEQWIGQATTQPYPDAVRAQYASAWVAKHAPSKRSEWTTAAGRVDELTKAAQASDVWPKGPAGKLIGPSWTQYVPDGTPKGATSWIDEAVELPVMVDATTAVEIPLRHAAQRALANIVNNPKGKTKLAAAVKKNLADYDGLVTTIDDVPVPAAGNNAAIALLEESMATAAEQQAKAELASTLTGYKKKILAGKLPTPKQQAAFDGLDDAAKAKVTDDIAQKQAAANQAAAEAAAAKQAADAPGYAPAATPAAEAKAQALAELDEEVVATAKSLFNQIDPANITASQGKDLEGILLVLDDEAADALTATNASTEVWYAKVAKALGYGDDVAQAPTKSTLGAGAEKYATMSDALIANKHGLQQVDQAADAAAGYDALIAKGVTEADAEELELYAQTLGTVILPDTDAITIASKIAADFDLKPQKGLPGFGDEALDAAAQAAAPTASSTQASVATTTVAGNASKMSVPKDLDFGEFDQIGPQGGSNPGALYVNRETGEKWYIKTPKTAEHARNEVLAARLYELAGTDVAEVQLITVNGQQGVASRIIDGLENVGGARLAKTPGAAEGFAADAWLANWDSVGLGFDNLLVGANRAYRIDTGGALRFRAQGASKGAAWGDVVDELDSLRNPGVNRQAAAVFGPASTQHIEDGVRRILAITDSDLEAAVAQYGPKAKKARTELLATLQARREDLRKRFPHLVDDAPPAPAPADVGAPLSTWEAKRVAEARGNGFTVARDGPDIEDQAVLVWNETDADGVARTAVSFKVRGAAQDRIDNQIRNASGAGGEAFSRHDVDEKITTAVKGISMRAAKGDALEAKDIQRARDAITAHIGARADLEKAVRDGLHSQAQLDRFNAHYDPWISALREIDQNMRAGQAAVWSSPTGKFFGAMRQMKRTGTAKKGLGLEWRRDTGRFERKEIDRGYLRGTGSQLNTKSDGVVIAELEDGTVIRYFGEEARFALRGQVDILVPGSEASSMGRVADMVERELGIRLQPPTVAEAEHLYLSQIAAHAGRYDLLDTAADQLASGVELERVVDDLHDVLSGDLLAGRATKSLRELPAYNPAGERQAYENGRRFLMRPDFVDDPKWKKFAEGNRVISANTNGSDMALTIERILDSGGQMAPTTDKLRRGFEPAGMSPDADLNSGGASYFFTRLRTKATAHKHAGFVWRADPLRRLDAITYNHDAFGRVTGDYVRQNRKTGIAGYNAAKKGASNETIFKGSMSLFDDLDRIVASSAAERNRILAVFRKAGYDEWPDGRALEDVVRLRE